MHDDTVQLWTGSAVGDNNADGATDWSTGVIVEASYGGAADDWNASLSASDVRASSFGAVLKCVNEHGLLGSTPSVDYFKINAYYTENPTEPGFQYFIILLLIALALQYTTGINLLVSIVLFVLYLHTKKPKKRAVTGYAQSII
jgi:hypothetical protein